MSIIHTANSYKYQLCVRQHPKQARTSNLRDGRTIEPPPILELVVTDSSGKRIKDLSVIEFHKFVLNVQLVIPKKMITSLSMLNLLDGSTTVDCRKLFDPENKCYSLFFVFPDLCCRGKGQYVFKISLFDIMDFPTNGQSRTSICTIETNTFTVYSPKEYPGRLPISKLSYSFLNQGIPIQATKMKRHVEDFEASTCLSPDLESVDDKSNDKDSGSEVLRHSEYIDKLLNTEDKFRSEAPSTEKVKSKDLDSAVFLPK